MKGQNQAVATILLISLTVSAVGIVSTQYNEILRTQKESTEVEIDIGKLSKETCWEEKNAAGNTVSKMALRNGQENYFNTSRITLLINDSISEPWYSQGVVSPGDTFVVNTTEDLGTEAAVKLVTGGGESISFSCPNY